MQNRFVLTAGRDQRSARLDFTQIKPDFYHRSNHEGITTETQDFGETNTEQHNELSLDQLLYDLHEYSLLNIPPPPLPI